MSKEMSSLEEAFSYSTVRRLMTTMKSQHLTAMRKRRNVSSKLKPFPSSESNKSVRRVAWTMMSILRKNTCASRIKMLPKSSKSQLLFWDRARETIQGPGLTRRMIKTLIFWMVYVNHLKLRIRKNWSSLAKQRRNKSKLWLARKIWQTYKLRLISVLIMALLIDLMAVFWTKTLWKT